MSFAPARRANWPTSPVRGRRRRRLIGFRWLLLLLFPAGYLAAHRAFTYSGAENLALSVVSLAACALLLSRLDRPISVSFPSWILLGIFCVGYYLQFFLLALDPEVYSGLTPGVREASEHALVAAYRMTTLAFLVFCATGWSLLGMKRFRSKATAVQTRTVYMTARSARFICRVLLVGIVLLELVTGYLFWTTGIAVMAAEAVVLPYRLAGAIFYTRFVILPALCLPLIWLADRFKFQSSFRVGIGLLILHGVADAVLRSSRATVVFALIELLLLFGLSQGLNRKRLRWIAVGFVLALLSFPVLTVYRNLRAGSNSSEIAAPLIAGVEYTYGSEHLGDILSDTFSAYVFRVSGMGSLLEIAVSGSKTLGLAHASQVTISFNQDILHIPAGVLNSVAPSLVGWFCLVGGNMAVPFGIAAFVALSHLIWVFLGSSRLLSKPVAQALFLMFLVAIATDGVLEGSLWTAFGVVLSIAAIELLLRAACVRNVAIARGEVCTSRVLISARQGAKRASQSLENECEG